MKRNEKNLKILKKSYQKQSSKLNSSS